MSKVPLHQEGKGQGRGEARGKRSGVGWGTLRGGVGRGTLRGGVGYRKLGDVALHLDLQTHRPEHRHLELPVLLHFLHALGR